MKYTPGTYVRLDRPAPLLEEWIGRRGYLADPPTISGGFLRVHMQCDPSVVLLYPYEVTFLSPLESLALQGEGKCAKTTSESARL